MRSRCGNHRCTAPGSRSRRVAGCLALLLGLQAGLEPVLGASRTLRFNGTNQFVELPLGETITLDNLGPRVIASPVEAWTEAGATQAFQTSSLATTQTGAQASWRPLLPRPGQYDVYAWWGRIVRAGSVVPLDTAAEYTVKHADGSATMVQNQNARFGQWVLLGRFAFNADGQESVSVRRTQAGAAPTLADAVRFVTAEAFDLTRALTLEAWIKVAAFDRKWQAIITKGNAWGLTRYDETGRLAFRTHDGLQSHDLVSSQSLVPHRWYHVAAVYDGSHKVLYLDGTVSASAPYSASLVQTVRPVVMGANPDNPGGDFKGQLENVRIWSVVRSQADLQAGAQHHLRGNEAGLIGDWRFDEQSGLTARDSAQWGLHGLLRQTQAPPTRVLESAFEFGPPPAGPHALRFNGYDQTVMVPADPRWNLTTDLTLETWLTFDVAPVAPAAVVSKGPEAWELILNPNQQLVFRTAGVTEAGPLNPANPVPVHDLISRERLEPRTWYHVAVRWDGPAGRKDLFLNGRLDVSATSLQGLIAINPKPLQFAAQPTDTGATGHFDGVLDEVRLWNIAREDQQIAGTFGRNLTGTEPGLAGYWPFNEGDGELALDASLGQSPAHGYLQGGMNSLNRVAGRVLDPALPPQYCLEFTGGPGRIEIPSADVFTLTNVTIEAWVKPTGTGWRTILRKGDLGYGLALDGDHYLRCFTDSTLQNSLRSSRPLEPERDAEGRPVIDSQGQPVMAWNHVAVVVNRAANLTTFYLNGRPAGSHPLAVIVNSAGPLLLGRQGTVVPTHYYRGLLDEVRLWSVARTPIELELYAFAPLMGTAFPGLVGYWNFNEGSGLALFDHSGGRHHGVLTQLDSSPWRMATDWGMPGLPSELGELTPHPDSRGLWIGQVMLNRVNEVQQALQGAAENLTPTSDTASFRILLHVAADGQVRLLKDVIVMQRETEPDAPPPASDPDLVLVTRPELIANFRGVTRRGGRMVGLRYGTVAYDFDGTELAMLGGVGPGTACLGRIMLSRAHPTNPYRHKYHPDHGTGFDLTRQFQIQFDGQPGDPLREGPGYGVDRLTGVYRETIVGLHKIQLKVEGAVELNRISTTSTLNE